MATPPYIRSPFGLMKRIKISPPVPPRIQRVNMSFAEFLEESGISAEDVAKERGISLPSKERPSLDLATQEVLNNTQIPRNVQAIYLRPLKRTPQYGVPTCDLQLRSYSVRNLEFFADFALRAAYYLNLPAKGPVPLPKITERWTVPRSNFVHKKSQENFERITLRRLIQVQDGHPETVQIWLGFLEKYAFYGVGMKANVWEYEGLGVGERMDESAEGAKELLDEKFRIFGTRKNAATGGKIVEMLGEDVFKRAAHGDLPMSSR